jgi:hypothetical protein
MERAASPAGVSPFSADLDAAAGDLAGQDAHVDFALAARPRPDHGVRLQALQFGRVRNAVEAFDFDARAARARCESDPVLGSEVTRRLALVVAKRLQTTLVKLITATGQPAGLGRS